MSARVVTDELDEQIIALLREEGRMTNRALARAVGISETATSKRLRRLLDSGACSYGLLVDREVTGMSVSGWLYVAVQPKAAAAVLRHIAGLDTCSLSARTTGPYNLVAYLYGPDLPGMAKTIESIAALEGVSHTRFRQAVAHPAHRYEFVALSDFGAPGFWHLADEE